MRGDGWFTISYGESAVGELAIQIDLPAPDGCRRSEAQNALRSFGCRGALWYSYGIKTGIALRRVRRFYVRATAGRSMQGHA